MHGSSNPPFLRFRDAIILAAALGIGAIIRWMMRDYESSDFILFFGHWYDIIAQKGGLYALREQFTNYTPPYTYLLLLATIIPLQKLYAIKLIMCIFDLALAWLAFLIVRELRGSGLLAAISFAIVFIAPTVMINSALWGQCDAVYTTFLLGMIYFLLRGKNLAAVAMWSLAFAFKQQAIFLLPVILILMCRGSTPLKYLLVIPVVYLVMILPSLLAGRPFIELLTIYLHQAGGYSGLSHNAPTFYGALGNIHYNPASVTWIIAACVLAIVAGYLALRAFFTVTHSIDKLLKFAMILLLIAPLLTFLRPFADIVLASGRSPSAYLAISGTIPGAAGWMTEDAPHVIGFTGLLVAMVIIGILCFTGARPAIAARRNSGLILTVSLLSALLVPFVLVRMHERYFYPADVIAILFAFRYPRYFYIPLLIICTSLLSYSPYLLGREIVPMPVLSMVVGLTIVIVMSKFAGMLGRKISVRSKAVAYPSIITACLPSTGSMISPIR